MPNFKSLDMGYDIYRGENHHCVIQIRDSRLQTNMSLQTANKHELTDTRIDPLFPVPLVCKKNVVTCSKYFQKEF